MGRRKTYVFDRLRSENMVFVICSVLEEVKYAEGMPPLGSFKNVPTCSSIKEINGDIMIVTPDKW
jgi:hypothetical protein